ncbi:unnamed protein product [Cladocopium goreaui]|uniref:Anoctamin-10 (Transmembrane protein 16K) n=1 Tax=Cladocopium goreaui TaxID=2562237 RepID=A0A9P1GJ91_9DINO|nr:unnamed protein product [Cladocopium goreaui]
MLLIFSVAVWIFHHFAHVAAQNVQHSQVQQLKIKAAQDISSWTLEDPDESPEASPSLRPDELLRRLKDAGLSYRLGSSAAGEFVFCLVRLPEQTAQANLAFYPIDLQLDADHAQRYASDLGMLLGLRSESCDFQEIDTCESYDSRTGEAQSPLGTLEDVWADLHMRFCPQIPRRVFQHYPLVSGLDKGNDQLSSILPPSQRLRMLLSLVGDDLPGAVGTMGPGLKLDQWKKPKFYNCLLHTCRNFGANRVARVAAGHTQREFPRAFSLYFLMQDPRDATFQRLRMKFGRPGSALFRHGLLSGVVDKQLPWSLQHYFGQQIGFYFAFMQHLFSYGFALSVLLAPLLAVYSVDWARHLVQAVAQEKPLFLLDEMVSEISDASQSRWPLWSLMIGLTTTIWGQCVIESWHRQEKRLARQWGCHPWRRALTRPSFRGKLAVSRVDGRLVLVHRNRRLFQARVIAVNLCFLSIWGIVFAVLGAIFLRADQVQVATENYASLGVMFSVASVLMYHLFRLVANALTEAENHRIEASWETSILLKKWALTVIVQCYPLLHLLFIRPYLWPCAYGNPELRQTLGIEQCEFWDQECCDQELRNGQVVLSFADVRGDAVLRHARQFIAGWLVSKIFMHNLLKWIIPRLWFSLHARSLPTLRRRLC